MNKTIALDVDGVILDYNKSWPAVWKAAFGQEIVSQRVCFHAYNEFGTGHMTDEQFAVFKQHFTEEAWSTMPLLDGAKEACLRLHDAGYRLVAVTSMPKQYQEARAWNLRELHGLPFDDVIATGRVGTANPKLPYIEQLNPVAFVDDFGHNFYGVDRSKVHCALIEYEFFDTPNADFDHSQKSSQHQSLQEFADYWLSR